MSNPIARRPVRGAIFGYGSIGPVHLVSVRGSEDGSVTAIPDVELVAVAEPVAERAARVPTGITVFPNYETLLNELDVDVIHVCLAHHQHAPAAIAAAEKGVNIICEKPMALDAPEAQRMVDAVKANGVGFSLISQNRLNPEKIWLKKNVESGAFGQIARADWTVDWFRSAAYYADGAAWRGKDSEARGGVLTNQAYHTLDLVMWLMDSPVKSVCATSSTNLELHPGNDVPDLIEGSLEFANGVTTKFLATVCGNPKDVIDVVVEGTKDGKTAMARVDGGAVLEQTVAAETPVFDTAAALGGKACYGNSHQENIARSYEAFMNGTPVPVDGETGVRVLKAIDAILASNGKTVTLA